jgi:hypothetical protein
MTQEEKQILLRGLCARLPYGVYVDAYSWQKDTPKLLIECVPEYVGEEIVVKGLAGRHSIREIKPYLRPMSSMTEGEILEFIRIGDSILRIGEKKLICILSLKQMDWLNAHHFDYRGLIPMGLALEAPEGMYE